MEQGTRLLVGLEAVISPRCVAGSGTESRRDGGFASEKEAGGA